METWITLYRHLIIVIRFKTLFLTVPTSTLFVSSQNAHEPSKNHRQESLQLFVFFLFYVLQKLFKGILVLLKQHRLTEGKKTFHQLSLPLFPVVYLHKCRRGVLAEKRNIFVVKHLNQWIMIFLLRFFSVAFYSSWGIFPLALGVWEGYRTGAVSWRLFSLK